MRRALRCTTRSLRRGPTCCRFSITDGQMSVFMVREIFNAAFRELKRAFSREETEAIDLFRETAQRLQFETRLEAGEATFLNNYTVMHARSEFEDWDEP